MDNSLPSKLEDFATCFDEARPIWDRRKGLRVAYGQLDSRPFDALMFFTMYAHERPQADPRYQVAHRIAVLRAIGAADAMDTDVNERFVSAFSIGAPFPEAVWEQFVKCLKGDDREPNRRYTLGSVRRILERLCEAGEPNLVVFLRSRPLREAYGSLRGIGGGIGPKIASLFLRDVWGYVGPWPNTPEGDLYCVQPVDRWVEFWARRCWPTESWPKDRKDFGALIVKHCRAEGVDPIGFNKGAWFVGAYFQRLRNFFKLPLCASPSRLDPVAGFDGQAVRAAVHRLNVLEADGSTFPL